MKFQKALFVVLIISVLVFMTGCAAGSNSAAHMANQAGIIAGFWQGLWHGMIFPITFGLSVSYDTVSVYEIHNNGSWYNLGFLLGVGFCFGSSSAILRSRE